MMGLPHPSSRTRSLMYFGCKISVRPTMSVALGSEPLLLDGLRQFPHRIRGRTAAAFVDAGEDFVQTDPVAIPEPDGLNPPFCVRGVAFELKRQSNCGFSDSLRIGLRNNTPDFDGVGNQIRPSDLGDLLSRFIMGKTC